MFERLVERLDREDEVKWIPEIKLSEERVKGIRLQLLRKITGKCPICGVHVETGQDTCSKHQYHADHLLVPDTGGCLQLLRQVDSRTVLIQRPCPRCGILQDVDVDDVLRVFRFNRPVATKQLCGECRRHQRLQQRPKGRIKEVYLGLQNP